MAKARTVDREKWQPGRFITELGWATKELSKYSPLRKVVDTADAAIRKMMGK